MENLPAEEKKTSLASQKKRFREIFQKKREALSSEERFQAKKSLANNLFPQLEKYDFILSFCSFSTEIDTLDLNIFLSKRKKLLLPLIVKNEMHIFFVKNPEKQLQPNRWGILEPIESRCARVSLSEISFILTPGLSFDLYNNRLGYGRGFYDRMLKKLPACPKYGLGFLEQFSPIPIPAGKNDISLTGILF